MPPGPGWTVAFSIAAATSCLYHARRDASRSSLALACALIAVASASVAALVAPAFAWLATVVTWLAVVASLVVARGARSNASGHSADAAKRSSVGPVVLTPPGPPTATRSTWLEPADSIVSSAEGSERDEREPASAPAAEGPLRVLVVDDQEIVLTTTGAMLRSIGHEVELVSSGEQALAELRRTRGEYDLVVLDVTMPDLDGWTVLERMLERWPSLAVVMTSGYPQEEPRSAAGDEPGHRGFLQKPYIAAELAEAIEAALERDASRARF